MQPKLDNDYIFSNLDVQMINSNKSLRFEVVDELKSRLYKSQILGLKVKQLRKNVYTIEDNKEVVVISHESLKLFRTINGVFYDSNFTDIKLANTCICTEDTLSALICNCPNLTSVDFTGMNTENSKTARWMVYHCSNLQYINLGGIDTSKVVDMASMFSHLYKLTKIEGLHKIDTSSAVNISRMFSCLESIEELDLSELDFSNVTNMDNIFEFNANLKKINMPGLKNKSNIKMQGVFSNCAKLQFINMQNFIDCDSSIFYQIMQCKSLKELRIKKSHALIESFLSQGKYPKDLKIITDSKTYMVQ